MVTGHIFTKTDESTTASYPYRECIGSILYASINTRPDISYATGILGRFASKFNEEHVKAIEKLFGYLNATKDHCLEFTHCENPILEAYCDASYGSNYEDYKSTTGWIIYLGKNTISWNSSKQSTMATSACEAEIIAATDCAKEVIWIRQVLTDMKFLDFVKEPTVIHCDNQALIQLVGSNIINTKSKHNIIKLHYLRELQSKGEIVFKYISTEDQIADVLTKSLNKSKIESFRKQLNVTSYHRKGSVDSIH